MLFRLIFRILVFILLLIPVSLQSQSIKGKITDNKEIPIPFVVVYDETTYSGTTSNAEGFYELKLDSGKHSLVYKAMGYNQVKKSIVINKGNVLFDVMLKEQPVELKEVIIRPGKEDPAYAMMRKVISRAPYHLNQVQKYTADVYLRGTAHIIKIPKFISKRMDVNGEGPVFKSGDVYLEESVNQISFTAPDTYEQKVISIRSTFPWNNEDIDPMGLINSSFYEPKVGEFISPLAPNAFQFYKYEYMGFFEEGSHVIFKIKVIPRHNNQQLMSGFLYIVNRLWCLHSADVTITMFFGSMNYKTIYSPVKSNAWLPVSHQFFVEASLLGMEATFKYSGSVKFSQVELSEKAAKIIKPVEADATPIPQTEVKKSKGQEQIDALLSKEDLSNRDVVRLSALMAREASHDTIPKEKSLEIKEEASNTKLILEKDAVKNDTSYWNEIRPIPLSSIEAAIPSENVARAIKQKSDTLTLSVGVKSSEKKAGGKFFKFITNGAGFYMFDSATHVQYEGLVGLNKFDFNTVDGFIYRQTFTLTQNLNKDHKLFIEPGVAWAFNREKLMWWTRMNMDYAPMRGGRMDFYIGSVSTDYNSETGINSTINTISSLFFRRNYMKLYQQQQIQISNRIDLANGLNLSVSAGYRIADPLRNYTDFSFFYQNSRDYTENIPGDPDRVTLRNLHHEEAFWDAAIEFTPRYHYRIKQGKKEYEYSRFPTLFIRNRMAIPGIFKSTADFDFLEAGLKQTLSWEMSHSFTYSIQGGSFLNRNRIYAMDDKYFNNHDLPLTIGNNDGAFRLTPYYRNATAEKYASAFIRYTTPYLLLKYLPWVNNKLWVESLQLNYLTTGYGRHYLEAGYILGQIYMMGSIGVFAGFTEHGYTSSGVKFSIDL